MKDLLLKLSQMNAPTGYEDEIAAFLSAEFKKSGFEVKTDVLGNVIARKGKGKKLLFAAHMDEIGLAVTSITKEGFLNFMKIGGIYNGTLGASNVVIHAKKRVNGVVGIKPPHLMKDEELKRVLEKEEMFIDAGFKSKEEAEKAGVRPGTFVSFDAIVREMENGQITGKAFDNRAGVAILVEVAKEFAKRNPPCELVLVGTVREETGLWGAGTSVYEIEPDLAVSIDVTMTGGIPSVPEDKVPVLIGKGPAIGVIEAGGRGMIMAQNTIAWIESVARRNKLNLQYETAEGGATDASRMQYQRSGVHAANISVPSKYIHSRTEVISLKDLEDTKKLAIGMVVEFNGFKP